MQETTFNSDNQADGTVAFDDVKSWLDAHYLKSAPKKFEFDAFLDQIIKEVSFNNLEKNLHYKFSDPKNLVKALIQSTFSFETFNEKSLSNERLEFIGDSLINLLVGKNLFTLFKDLPEGELSKLRGALVNEDQLAALAKSVSLNTFVFVGKGEYRLQGNEKESILADAFEAVMAAIFLDADDDLAKLQVAFDKIITSFEKENEAFYELSRLEFFDPKSKLQELTMAHNGSMPIYQSSETGENGHFKTQILINEKVVSEIVGNSKKKNEKKLAQKVISEKLFK